MKATVTTMLKPDVVVYGEGPGTSVFLFQLHTPRAKRWVKKHVPLESWQWRSDTAFAVEHRYAADLTAGMQADGLVVH